MTKSRGKQTNKKQGQSWVCVTMTVLLCITTTSLYIDVEKQGIFRVAYLGFTTGQSLSSWARWFRKGCQILFDAFSLFNKPYLSLSKCSTPVSSDNQSLKVGTVSDFQSLSNYKYKNIHTVLCLDRV